MLGPGHQTLRSAPQRRPLGFCHAGEHSGAGGGGPALYGCSQTRSGHYQSSPPIPRSPQAMTSSPFSLMDKYFASSIPLLGMSREEFYRLGIDPTDPRCRLQHDRLCPAAVCPLQCREQEARRGGPAHVAAPVAGPAGGTRCPSAISLMACMSPPGSTPELQRLFNRYLGPEWLADHDNPSIWAAGGRYSGSGALGWFTAEKIKLINAIRRAHPARWIESMPDPAISSWPQGSCLIPIP